MIYGVSKSNGEGLEFYRKPYNPRTNVLVKPSYPSSSSNALKGLNVYFMHAAENGKILNQSEPVINNSQVLRNSRSQTLKSKVLENSELKVVISKVPRGSEVKLKTYSR